MIGSAECIELPGDESASRAGPVREPWIVAHIITKLELGGAQRATLTACAKSTFASAPRYLLCGSGGLLDAEAAALAGVVVLPVPALGRAIAPGDDARAVTQIWTQLRHLRAQHPGRPLLVHTHSSKAGILGRWAARAAGAARIVHSIHGFGHHGHMRWPVRRGLWMAERATAAITDGFTADSAANLRRGCDEGIIGGHPCTVVHCGIDVQAFRAPHTPPAEVRAALGIPARHQVVLQLACLKPQKDPLAVVRLAHQLRHRLPHVTYLMAGDGELRDAVEALAASLGVADRVRLLGWRRDVADLLHASDLLLLTSRWEGLPQVFAQAMAAGRAIVATDVDGAPEAVLHGETGLLVPACDPNALADAVAAVLVDTPLRQRMGAAGRAGVEAFSEATMVRRLDDFYARVTAEPGTDPNSLTRSN